MQIMVLMLAVLMLVSVAVTVIRTVTEVVAALGLGEQNGLVHVSVHAPSLHGVVGVTRVERNGWVTWFEALRREKCMVNLLKVGLHSVVWSDHRRVAHRPIVEVRIATHRVVVMTSEGAVPHFLC